MHDYPCAMFEEDRDTGHSQRQNVSLNTARSHKDLKADKLRDPNVKEGLSFSEALNTRDYYNRR